MERHMEDPKMAHMISVLWDGIERKFAQKSDVFKLAQEIKKLDEDSRASSTRIASTAAAMVIKEVRDEIFRKGHGGHLGDLLNKAELLNMEICLIKDSKGHPDVRCPNFNTIYLTLEDVGEEDDIWDLWIAVPRQLGKCKTFKWGHVGSTRIDLSWVKENFKNVNRELELLNMKIHKFSKDYTKLVLDKFINPLEELKAFINSPEMINMIMKKLPRANWGQDGLMSGSSFGLLIGLSLWASNDHKIMGGGAMGTDYVIQEFERRGEDMSNWKKPCMDHA